jgi:hypothetical protein
MKEWDPTLVAAEYSNLRAEILKRVEIRYQLLALSITIFGALLAFVSQTKDVISLFFYPMLALFFAISWRSNQQDIWKLSDYIKKHIEDKVGQENIHWEGYSNLRGDKSSAQKYLSFGSKGVFVITELFAILIGIILAITQPGSNNIILVSISGCFSVLFTIVTTFILWQKRAF